MPQQAWNAKRERQYEHVKDSLEERGTPKKKAKEIAARTVNKERARAGEAGSRRGSPARTSPPAAAAGFGPGRAARRAARATSSTKRRRA